MAEKACWEFMNSGSVIKYPEYPRNGADCRCVPSTLGQGEGQQAAKENHENCILKRGFPEMTAKYEF